MNNKRKIPALRKGLAFLVAASFLAGISYSQSRTREEVIYLKNGSIIRGELLKESNPEYLRIRSEGNNIWSFSRAEVDSVVQSEIIPLAGAMAERNGFKNMTGFGVLIGSGDSEKRTVFSLSTVNGYRFDRNWFAGIHSGLELFEYSTCPLGGDLRFYFIPGRWSSFLYLKGGYSLALEKPEEPWGTHYQARGGPWLGLGSGMEIQVNERNSLLFELAYRYQDLYLYYTTDWQTEKIKETTRFNRLEIRFAISFF